MMALHSGIPTNNAVAKEVCAATAEPCLLQSKNAYLSIKKLLEDDNLSRGTYKADSFLDMMRCFATFEGQYVAGANDKVNDARKSCFISRLDIW